MHREDRSRSLLMAILTVITLGYLGFVGSALRVRQRWVQLFGVPGQAVVLGRDLEQRTSESYNDYLGTWEYRAHSVAFVSLALLEAGPQGARSSPTGPVVTTRASWRFYSSVREGQVVRVKSLRGRPNSLVILDDMRFPEEDWHWFPIILGAALLVTFWEEALEGRLARRQAPGVRHGPTHSTPDN